MALTKYKLGALIELCDVRNYDGIYTLDDIRGISTGKEFIETKANMDGVSLSSYKVVDCQEFVYVADTSRRGDKIAIAFNTVEKPVLISSIYTVFRVVDKDIFSAEYFEKLSDVKMPASKLELLVKMLRKQISEYSKTNQMAAKKFQEMLEETIKQYHERRKHLTAEEAGEAQEYTSEEIIRNATEQALRILKEMNADRESFRKIGLTFEEKAFYDILMALRDEYNFEYGADELVDGITVNDKCKALAKKIKEIIDTKSSFADWLNNHIVRDQLKFDIKVCLIKNGYPPQYSPEVFRKVMEQVENFEENN